MQPYVEGVFVDVLLGLLNVVPGHVLRQRHLHEGHVTIGQRQEGQLKAGRYLEPPQVGRGRKVSAEALERLQPTLVSGHNT